LDLPAFLLAAGADSEVHLTYLPGLLTLLTTSGRYVEEWVRVFYATVWIRDGNGDPIPDSPWGIPLLGDGDGEVSSPTGM
jgi:hypothetical protein